MSFHVQKTNTELSRFEWLSAEPTFVIDGYGVIMIQTSWTADDSLAYDFVTDELASKWAAGIGDSLVVRFGSATTPIQDENYEERRQNAVNVLVDELAETGHVNAQNAKSQRDAHSNNG